MALAFLLDKTMQARLLEVWCLQNRPGNLLFAINWYSRPWSHMVGKISWEFRDAKYIYGRVL